MKEEVLVTGSLHNAYDPNYKDPFWKATIKKIIGRQTTELEKMQSSKIMSLKTTLKTLFLWKQTVAPFNFQSLYRSWKSILLRQWLMEEIRQLVAEESNAFKRYGSTIFQKL